MTYVVSNYLASAEGPRGARVRGTDLRLQVRWPKVPPSRIFTTWRARLEGAGVEFRNATRVAKVLRAQEGTDAVGGVELEGGEVLEADAVILACGAAALPKIVAASEALRGCAGLARCGELRCSPVSAVRLRRAGGSAPLRYEANVFGGSRPGVAGTFYDLGALRGEERGREFEVDAYNFAAADEADAVAAAREVLCLADPSWASAAIEEASVRTAVVRNAATRFEPGSHGCTPDLRPAGAPRGLYVAGDLVKNGPAEFAAHRGARGLSQEKALVTGLSAARGATKDLTGRSTGIAPLPVEEDEPHIRAAKEALRRARAAGLAPPLLV